MTNEIQIRSQQEAIEAAVIAGDGEVLGDWGGWTTSHYIDCRYRRVMFTVRLSDHGVGLRRGMDSRTLFLFNTNTDAEITSEITDYLKRIDKGLDPEINAKAEFEAKGLSIKTNKYGKPLKNGYIIKWQKALRLASN